MKNMKELPGNISKVLEFDFNSEYFPTNVFRGKTDVGNDLTFEWNNYPEPFRVSYIRIEPEILITGIYINGGNQLGVKSISSNYRGHYTLPGDNRIRIKCRIIQAPQYMGESEYKADIAGILALKG